MCRYDIIVRTIEYTDECPLTGTEIPILDGVPILIHSRTMLRIWLKSQGLGHDSVGGGNSVIGCLGLECLAKGVLRAIRVVVDWPVRRVFGQTKIARDSLFDGEVHVLVD